MICPWLVRGFLLAYVVALCLFLIGTFGWFGAEAGPLAGVFLLPLGLPWNRLLGWAPAQALAPLAAAAPLINLAILRMLCARHKRA